MHCLESTKPCPFLFENVKLASREIIQFISNFLVPFQFVRISTFIIPDILGMSLVD